MGPFNFPLNRRVNIEFFLVSGKPPDLPFAHRRNTIGIFSKKDGGSAGIGLHQSTKAVLNLGNLGT